MKKSKRVTIKATGPEGGGKTLCLQILHRILSNVAAKNLRHDLENLRHDLENLRHDLEKHKISFDAVDKDTAAMLARTIEE